MMDCIDAVVVVASAKVEVVIVITVVTMEVGLLGTGTTLADSLAHNYVEVAVTVTPLHPVEITKY